MSRIYDVTLGAAIGSTQNIGATGNKFKIYSAPNGAVNVRVDGGDSFTLFEGQGVTLAQPFRDLTVSNMSGVAQTVQIFAGDARIDDARISGVVSVIDGGKARTLADQAFIGYMGSTSAAGMVNQLFNPAGSGKRLLTRQLRVTNSVAGIVQYGYRTTAVATGPFNPVNKKTTSVALGAAKLYFESTAVAPATGVESLQLLANTPLQLAFQEPISIEPGSSMVVWFGAACTLTACWDFFEEPI